MAKSSKIQWTDSTFNPVRGCTKVSLGCQHCYAARESARFPTIRGVWGDAGTRVVAIPGAWREPLVWDAQAKAAGKRTRVFCASLGDVFEDWQGELHYPEKPDEGGYSLVFWVNRRLTRIPVSHPDYQTAPAATMDQLRQQLFELIELTPNLDWQLLTKRPENVMKMIPDRWFWGLPDNVWMGTTVENQDLANKRIPLLLDIPARVRFLSCEPLLGPVEFRQVQGLIERFNRQPRGWENYLKHKIHQVIVGGESGKHARPMHPDWARQLRDQCAEAGIPFFFKQWGEFMEYDAPGQIPGAAPREISSIEEGLEILKDVANPAWVSGDGQLFTEYTSLPFDEPCRLLNRVGVHAAGRILDGVTHDGMPVV